MNEKISFNNSSLTYRNTPWDKKAFNLETKEILDFVIAEEEEGETLLDRLDAEFNSDGLVYFRADSNDQLIKKTMLLNEYYIAETAIKLTHNKIQSFNFSEIFKGQLVLEQDLNSKCIKDLKDIAKSAFKYSRFHEDPFLNLEHCNQRYENWIDDLVKQKKQLLFYKQNNELISFMFFEYTRENVVSLILGGSKNGFGLITPMFWASLLEHLRKAGVKNVEVIISASNIVVFNIYLKLGFQIKKTFLDYHKIKKKG